MAHLPSTPPPTLPPPPPHTEDLLPSLQTDKQGRNCGQLEALVEMLATGHRKAVKLPKGQTSYVIVLLANDVTMEVHIPGGKSKYRPILLFGQKCALYTMSNPYVDGKVTHCGVANHLPTKSCTYIVLCSCSGAVFSKLS